MGHLGLFLFPVQYMQRNQCQKLGSGQELPFRHASWDARVWPRPRVRPWGQGHLQASVRGATLLASLLTAAMWMFNSIHGVPHISQDIHTHPFIHSTARHKRYTSGKPFTENQSLLCDSICDFILSAFPSRIFLPCP